MLKKKKFKVIAMCAIFILVFTSIRQNVYAKSTNDTKQLTNTFNKVNVRNYNLNEFASFKERPANFNPINASNEELRYMGIPERPTDKNELQEWNNKIAKATWVSPSIVKRPNGNFGLCQKNGDSGYQDSRTDGVNLASTQATATTTVSNNWCGVIRESTSYGVAGKVTVPSLTATTANLPANCAAWVGTGGYSSSKLAQLGINGEVTSSGISFYAWFETIGTDIDGSAYMINGFTVSPGDVIYLSMWYDFSNSPSVDITYYWNNYTTNQYTNLTVTIASYANIANSAEWVIERPTSGTGTLCPLAKPTTNGSNKVYFTDCKYRSSNTVTSWTTASGGTECNMISSSTGNTLATTSSMSSGNLTLTWKNYK